VQHLLDLDVRLNELSLKLEAVRPTKSVRETHASRKGHQSSASLGKVTRVKSN